MKITFTILFFFSMIFISCKNETENTVKTIYNEQEYIYLLLKDKNIEKEVNVIDTFCINQTKRAKNDIKKNQLTHFVRFGNGNFDLSDKELSNLLQKHNINIDTVFIYCSRSDRFDKYCYQNLMNDEIAKRFGENFIDSLRHIADKQFIEKNPKYIFDFYKCELTSRYFKAKTYVDFLEMPENDFINYLKTKSSKKESATTEVFFVIYQDGTIGNIKTETDYSASKDKDFINLFEKEAINFIKKSKWLPGKYRGIPVNSEMHINFYNK